MMLFAFSNGFKVLELILWAEYLFAITNGFVLSDIDYLLSFVCANYRDQVTQIFKGSKLKINEKTEKNPKKRAHLK